MLAAAAAVVLLALPSFAVPALLPAPAAAQASPGEIDQVAQQFGGVYRDPELNRYVASIGQLLVSTTEMANRPFTFTVLDSPTVNAFSLPDGSIYVTRGLIALANSEAELASVLGHEIAHVTAGHASARQTRGTIAEIGAGLLGALLGAPSVSGIAGAGAQLYLQKFSRDQEYQADELGVRYISRAGYDPRAMAWFLRSLVDQSALEAQIAGRPPGSDGFSFMSDHPRTLDRVQRAIAEAAENPARQPMIERDVYLRKVNGIVYGSDPSQGVVRGLTFIHPELGFRFDVPQGFHVSNGERQVMAQGPDGAVIVFDRNPRPFRGSALAYLTNGWEQNLRLADVEQIEVNGMDAATGRTAARLQQGGTMDARLVAIRFDADTFYRFIFLAPPQAAGQFQQAFQRTTYSFRRLSRQEAAQIRPQRIRVVTVAPGDTISSLAARMQVPDLPQERFMVLNGLQQGEQPRAGDNVKLVVQQ
jgi:predicted Zn-dependent protease